MRPLSRLLLGWSDLTPKSADRRSPPLRDATLPLPETTLPVRALTGVVSASSFILYRLGVLGRALEPRASAPSRRLTGVCGTNASSPGWGTVAFDVDVGWSGREVDAERDAVREDGEGGCVFEMPSPWPAWREGVRGALPACEAARARREGLCGIRFPASEADGGSAAVDDEDDFLDEDTAGWDVCGLAEGNRLDGRWSNEDEMPRP